jgi:hypothetical protein
MRKEKERKEKERQEKERQKKKKEQDLLNDMEFDFEEDSIPKSKK